MSAPAVAAGAPGAPPTLQGCGVPLVEAQTTAGSMHSGSERSPSAGSSVIREVALSPDGTERTLYDRWVGPLTVDGIRHSTLTLCGTALGGGVLSVAYVMKQCGLVLGVFLLVAGASMAWASVSLLMQMSVLTGKHTYAGLFAMCAGRLAGPILDLMLFINGMGSGVGYLVFLGDFIPAIIRMAGASTEHWDHDVVRTTAICASCVVMLPLLLAKDISMLRYVTPVSICSLLYMACVVSFKAPALYDDHSGNAAYGSVEVFKLDIHVFEAFALCVFAFNCHLNVIPVAASLVGPSRARIRKVSFRVNVVQLIFYCLIGITGYLSFLGQTHSDILLGYDASDHAVAVGRILLSGTFMVALPLNLHPAIRSALQIGDFLTGREPSDNRLFAPRAALTIACLIVQALVAINVPQVGDVLSLIGGSVTTSIMLGIPAFAVRKIMPRTRKYKTIEALFWLFATVGIVSVPIKVLRVSGVIAA